MNADIIEQLDRALRDDAVLKKLENVVTDREIYEVLSQTKYLTASYEDFAEFFNAVKAVKTKGDTELSEEQLELVVAAGVGEYVYKDVIQRLEAAIFKKVADKPKYIDSI